MDLIWKDEYNTGFAIIDEQHRYLVCITQSLYKRLIENKYCNNETIEILFKNLYGYIDEHFKIEEDLMRGCKYKKIDKHLEEHEFFSKKVLEIHQEIKTGRMDKVVDLYEFLSHWFIRHIQTTDRIMIGVIKKNINLDEIEEI